MQVLLRVWTSFAVCTSLVVAWRGPGTLADSNHVWLLGVDSGYNDNYDYLYSSCDTTNVVALTKDGLHVDYFTTVEQIRMIRFNLTMPALFIQNRMINEEQQDEVFVAVHEGHISINRFGSYNTYPFFIGKPSSLFMIENLACLTPAVTSNILCVNVVKGTQKLCKDQIPPSSYGYTNIPTSTPSKLLLSYIVTPDRKTIMTFKVVDECVSFVSAVSGRNYGNNMWFSNNGTRVFLSNGLTLNSPSLSPNGTLGQRSVGEYTYTSVSQLYRNELQLKNVGNIFQPIMSLRDDVINQVFFFEWPDLSANGTEAIPSPDGYSIVRPISLQYCQPDFAYALVTYQRSKDNALRTGVAYLKSYS